MRKLLACWVLACAWQGLLSRAGTAGGGSAPGQHRPARTDLYGDPLPPGALARMGTVRLRHGSHVCGVAFSPDGKAVAAAAGDGLRLWDVSSGKEVRRLGGRDENYFSAVAFSPDGNRLAAVGSPD